MDTITYARQVTQILIDRYNENYWGCCITGNLSCMINNTYTECKYCPFYTKDINDQSIHKIFWE